MFASAPNHLSAHCGYIYPPFRQDSLSARHKAHNELPLTRMVVCVQNDVLISPRDRPMLSPRENRASRGLGCSVEASGLLSPRESYHQTEFGAGLESTDAGYSTYDSISPGAMRTPDKSSRSGSSEMGAGMGIGWTP